MFAKIAILAAAATCVAATQMNTGSEAHQKAFNGSLISQAAWKSYTTKNHKSMAANKKLRQARAAAVLAYFASRSKNTAAWAAQKTASSNAEKAATALAK
jgi:hypothetical protein